MTFISDMWLPLLISAGLAAFLMNYLNPIAHQIGLVDQPDTRKRHSIPIPLIGGIAIIVSIMFALPLLPFGLGRFRLFLLGLGILAIVGVLDDHQDLSARVKFIFQLVVASMLVLGDELVVVSIGDIFSWNNGNELGLGPLAVPLSIFAVIGIINAFNMIDGHDGLASSLFLVSIIAVIILTITGSGGKYVYLCSIFVVVVSVFLVFNLSEIVGEKRQIFLGDAGSMCLGLILVYVLIDLSQRQMPVLRTATAVWAMGIPVLDLVSVVIMRIQKKRSPLKADRQHIHHVLLHMGLTKIEVLITLVCLQVLFCTVAIVANVTPYISDWMLFWGMFPVLGAYYWVAHRCARTSN